MNNCIRFLQWAMHLLLKPRACLRFMALNLPEWSFAPSSLSALSAVSMQGLCFPALYPALQNRAQIARVDKTNSRTNGQTDRYVTSPHGHSLMKSFVSLHAKEGFTWVNFRSVAVRWNHLTDWCLFRSFRPFTSFSANEPDFRSVLMSHYYLLNNSSDSDNLISQFVTSSTCTRCR